MKRGRHLAATGLRSVVGLALSLISIALLRGVTASSSDSGAFRGPARRPDELLVVVLAWVGMALAAWLALGSALGLLSTAPGAIGRWCGRLAEHLTPLLVRRVLTVALGTSTVSLALPPASVVGTAAAPLPADPAGWAQTREGGTAVPDPRYAPTADSEPGYAPTADSEPGYAPTADSGPGRAVITAVGPGYHPTPETSVRQQRSASDPTPGFRPTRPPRAHDRAGSTLLTPPPRPTVAAHDAVTVRRGDSLWSIAARHLEAGASDAEVAREWPRWYAANRSVIGENPDLIRPGMQLVPPREGDLP